MPRFSQIMDSKHQEGVRTKKESAEKSFLIS